MNVINKITARSLPISKKEIQPVLVIWGFWRIFTPSYSLIQSKLILLTNLEEELFHLGPEQWQILEQIEK